MTWFGLCGPPSRGTALRTALHRTAQNFALFFPSPVPIFVLFLSLGVFSWNSGVFEAPAPSEPPGFHTTAQEELQTCTFQGPGASNTTKFSTRRPPEREKERKLWREREKKNATLRGPHPSGFGPFGALPFLFHPCGGPFGAPPLRNPTPSPSQNRPHPETYPCPKSPMPQPNRA